MKCHFCKNKLYLSNCYDCVGTPHFVVNTTVAIFWFTFNGEKFRAVYNWKSPYIFAIDRTIVNRETYDSSTSGMSGHGTFTEYKSLYRGSMKIVSAEEAASFVQRIIELKSFI